MIIEVAWQVNGVAAKIFLGAEDLSNFLSLARGFSDSTVDCEIRLNYSGRVCDLGEEESWKVGQRQNASSPPPPLVHPSQTCARALVHLNIHPRNHHLVSVEAQWWARVLRILGT